MYNLTARCHNCHTCGTKLIVVLDGDEWCEKCQTYRRYRSHGWAAGVGEESPCPVREAEFTLLFDDAAGDYSAEYIDTWED